MRTLTIQEEQGLKHLTAKGVEVALLEPTHTGLSKSILDATQSLRHLLQSKAIHDYTKQKQGPENKLLLPTKLLKSDSLLDSQATLYRPQTKNGDPRIWITGLGSYCNPNDIIAISVFEHELWVINLTQIDFDSLENELGPIHDYLEYYAQQDNYIARELLEKIRLIASRGYIPTGINADTSIGRLLETLLDIKINSYQLPDYKGIELKSFRSERNNRKGLFAQVPEWELSQFKSSKQILDQFGYTREEEFKLYCTVKATGYNSQGLRLKVDNKNDILIEESNDSSIGDFLVWKMETLRNRLHEKHAETFWVQADTKMINGQEYLKFTKIEHTKGPLVAQLDPLLSLGKISVDHLIKRSGTKVSEKGPLFKLDANSLGLLFPPSKIYHL